MDVRHYTLALEVDPANQAISGYTEIRINYAQMPSVILLDFWKGLSVSRVLVNNKTSRFEHTDDDLLKIETQHLNPRNLNNQTVRIYYNGKPGIAERPPWVGGFQWEKDSRGNPWVAITCQNEGGKIFFPCKDHPSDEPDEGADLIITVPKGLVVAGPGLLISQKTKGNLTTFHWRTRYPISNYCLVFNIGKFKKVSRPYTTIAGNTVPMDMYVLEENEDKAQSLLTLLEESCRILEKYFGEYPWVKEKIGICETPHLGMEHQTLNAYGNKFRYTKVGAVITTGCWCMSSGTNGGPTKSPTATGPTCGYRKASAHLPMPCTWKKKEAVKPTCRPCNAMHGMHKINCPSCRAKPLIPIRLTTATSTAKVLFHAYPALHTGR